MQSLEFTIFADHHQFYLQDDDIRFGDLSNAWTPEATERRLAVADHVVGIGTARNMNVAVRISFASALPDLEPTAWDSISRTSLKCDTGRIVVAGCTDYFPDAKRIHVAPGTYDVLIGYKNRESLSGNGLDGDDSYHIYLALQGKGSEHAAGA